MPIVADQVFMFGLGVGTTVAITLGPTLVVVESFDNDGSGDVFKLHGNNIGQTVVATRVSNIEDTISFVAECSSYVRAVSLMGKGCTVTMKDDSSPPGGAGQLSGPIAVAGKIITCKLAGGRGPWQYNITMSCNPV